MSKKGLFIGKSHAEGGIPSEVKETGQQIEIEGQEYYFCRTAYNSDRVFEFENKTNRQILDSIYSDFSCEFVQSSMSAGDFIVCKKVVLDDTKRNIKGTVKEILNQMQGEKSCKVEDSPSDMYKNGGAICPVGTEIQSIILSKDRFKNVTQAKNWIKKNKFTQSKVDEKDETYRFRQKSPRNYTKDSFRTIAISRGVKAVIGCPIDKKEIGGSITPDSIYGIDLEKTSNGIYFDEYIASVNGASFILYPNDSHTKLDIEIAKKELRNTRDVIAIKIAGDYELDELYKKAVFRDSRTKPLKWYQIEQDEKLMRSQRIKGTTPAEFVTEYVLPRVKKTEREFLKRSGRSIYKLKEGGGVNQVRLIPLGKLIAYDWKLSEVVDEISAGKLSYSKNEPSLVSYVPDLKKYLILDGHHRIVEQKHDGKKRIEARISEFVPKTYNLNDYPVITISDPEFNFNNKVIKLNNGGSIKNNWYSGELSFLNW